MPAVRPVLALTQPEDGQTKRRPHRATQPQLLTRSSIDGRTNAARASDRLVADIHAELGGRDQLSTIELALVEAFCGAAKAQAPGINLSGAFFFAPDDSRFHQILTEVEREREARI